MYTSDNSTYSLTQHENTVLSMLSYRALTVYIYNVCICILYIFMIIIHNMICILYIFYSNHKLYVYYSNLEYDYIYIIMIAIVIQHIILDIKYNNSVKYL